MNFILRTPILITLLLSAGSPPLAAAEVVNSESTKALGLSVHAGQLLLKGKPYRGIGANYFSLFSRTIDDASDTSYEEGLMTLSDANIPFVRFMACGFWPINWQLYQEDKEEYFTRFDRVVRSAEKHHIGLIPSLFWHLPTISDLVGEPLDQLANPDSKTSAFIRQYTAEVVLRYRDSPAIWGWEFANEINLMVDLPNASEHRPKVVPQLKTALQRSSRDELHSDAMICIFREFAKTVRQHDPHRILITGNSIPRASAYHNSSEKSWKQDTPEQFEQVLLRDNPDPFDTLCVHVYGNSGQAGTTSIAELVTTLSRISAGVNKPLFIGEFGASKKLSSDAGRALFEELLGALVGGNVPLSAFWVFDHKGQDADWNVTSENDRSYILKRIGAANKQSCKP